MILLYSREFHATTIVSEGHFASSSVLCRGGIVVDVECLFIALYYYYYYIGRRGGTPIHWCAHTKDSHMWKNNNITCVGYQLYVQYISKIYIYIYDNTASLMLYFSSPAHPRPYNIIVLMIIYYIIIGMYTVCAIIERASIIFRKPRRRRRLQQRLDINQKDE